jgi:predicted RNase H-like HicB family nuclease
MHIIHFFYKLINKPVVKADKVSGGYVAYYVGGDVVAQGETEEEALRNLNIDLKIVEDFKKNVNENETYSNSESARVVHS